MEWIEWMRPGRRRIRAASFGLIRAAVETHNVDADEIAGFAEAIIFLDSDKWIVVDVNPRKLLAAAQADGNFTGEDWTETNNERAGTYAAFTTKPPPVVVNILADGRLSILDGRHRLVSYKHKSSNIALAMPEKYVGNVMLKIDSPRPPLRLDAARFPDEIER